MQLKESYRAKARVLFNRMDDKRFEILDELSNDKPDTILLKKLSDEFGNMHSQLKLLTIDFYLDIKEISTPEEQEELNHYFRFLLKMENPKPRFIDKKNNKD
jgi:Spy/CpxP family protein refolding chaperone